MWLICLMNLLFCNKTPFVRDAHLGAYLFCDTRQGGKWKCIVKLVKEKDAKTMRRTVSLVWKIVRHLGLNVFLKIFRNSTRLEKMCETIAAGGETLHQTGFRCKQFPVGIFYFSPGLKEPWTPLFNFFSQSGWLCGVFRFEGTLCFSVWIST